PVSAPRERPAARHDRLRVVVRRALRAGTARHEQECRNCEPRSSRGNGAHGDRVLAVLAHCQYSSCTPRAAGGTRRAAPPRLHMQLQACAMVTAEHVCPGGQLPRHAGKTPPHEGSAVVVVVLVDGAVVVVPRRVVVVVLPGDQSSATTSSTNASMIESIALTSPVEWQSRFASSFPNALSYLVEHFPRQRAVRGSVAGSAPAFPQRR